MTLTGAKKLVDLLLKNPTVRIGNIANTTDKLEKLIQDGRSNLHFISDFDMTMSRHWVRNKETDALERNVSCHGIPGRYEKMSPEFKGETKRIYETYYPIEIDQSMTHEEKVPYMVKWWTDAHKLIVAQNLTKQDISDMTLQANIELRKKVDSVLKNCRDTNIPFLVFSAGIGDIIKDILRHENLYFENMHTVSNMMVFNDKDVCVDFREPLIHVFNKSEFQLETTPYHAMIEERRNVILMGDSLGDLQMSQGLQHDLCLNIGFLNHDIKSLEPAYTKSFDLVIEGDANMQPVMDILEFIE